MKPLLTILLVFLGILLSVHLLNARTYYYDDVGRLIQVSYADGNAVKYTYDAADNITLEEQVTVPEAPSNLKVVRDTFTSAQLEWDHEDSSETGFDVQRKTATSYGWETVGSAVAGASSFADDTLSENENYVYRVVATGSSGNSAFSNAVTASDVFSEPFEISAFASSLESVQARHRFAFESLAGATYFLERSSSLAPLSWEGVTFATSPDGVADQSEISGSVSLLNLYLDGPGEGRVFYRLRRSDPL